MNNISIDIEESNVFGITCLISEDNWINYLGAFFPEEKLIDIKNWFIDHKIPEIIILRNIYVDDDQRGKGIGNELLSKFIDAASNTPILLLSSPDEEGFPLTEWYCRHGFSETPFVCAYGPLLIKL